MDMWLKKYAKVVCSRTTFSTAEYKVEEYKKLFKNKSIKKIKPLDIQNMIAEKKKTCKDITVNDYLKILHGMFNTAIVWGYLKQNPCDGIKFKVIKKVRKLDFSLEYIEKLLKIFKDTKLYNIIFVALHTGMRRGEILGLKVKDIDFVKKELNIQRSLVQTLKNEIYTKLPKSGKTRVIDIDDTLLNLFSTLIEGKSEGDFIFSNIQPNYVTNTFNKVLKEHKDEIAHIRFHDLRHIHASILLANNSNQGNIIKIVQERLGHSSAKITLDIYSHLLPNSQANAIKCLENIKS